MKTKTKKRKGYNIGLFTIGNQKVPFSTVIFNMTPAEVCPAAKLGLCKHCRICYARKAERNYPQCLPYRYRQMKYWQEASASEFATMLSATILIASNRVKVDSFRFSEAGDFSSQADVEKMADVAKIIGKQGIVTYGYTARKDLNLKRLMKYAVVNGSGFMASNNFVVVDQPSNTRPVCPGNCENCSLCKKANSLTIEVVKH